jgi:hypothetical protein
VPEALTANSSARQGMYATESAVIVFARPRISAPHRSPDELLYDGRQLSSKVQSEEPRTRTPREPCTLIIIAGMIRANQLRIFSRRRTCVADLADSSRSRILCDRNRSLVVSLMSSVILRVIRGNYYYT